MDCGRVAPDYCRRAVHDRKDGRGRIPRPDGAYGRGHDRRRQPGGRGSGAARDVSDRNGRERGHRRAARTFFIASGLFVRLGGIRLGHRHFQGASDCERKDGDFGRKPAARRNAGIGAAIERHGRNHLYRLAGLHHVDDGPADLGRMGHQTGHFGHGRRVAGYDYRRRLQAIPGFGRSRAHERLRRDACRYRRGGARLGRERFGRRGARIWQRIRLARHVAHDRPDGNGRNVAQGL